MFGLFGSKAEVNVTLDKPAYLPGEVIRATIEVRGTKSLDVQAGRAELRYENEYSYRNRERDSDGDYHTVTRTSTDARTVEANQFWQGGTLGSGSFENYTVEFTLPTGCPPTGEGEIVKVKWYVQVVLDIKRAIDVTAEAPVVVLSPAEAYGDWANNEPFGKDQSECWLDIRLDRRSFRPAETITGTAVVQAAGAFNATDVRVELIQFEEVPEREGNTNEETHGTLVVAQDLQFQPGVNQEYPFQLVLPATLCPSLHTDHGAVHWGVKLVVARRLRSDYNLTKEIGVYTGPPPPEQE